MDGFKPGEAGTTAMAIKPAYIKNMAETLLERYPEAFSEDFEGNKESVEALTNIESKGVRNRVAGYVTRKIDDPAPA